MPSANSDSRADFPRSFNLMLKTERLQAAMPVVIGELACPASARFPIHYGKACDHTRQRPVSIRRV